MTATGLMEIERKSLVGAEAVTSRPVKVSDSTIQAVGGMKRKAWTAEDIQRVLDKVHGAASVNGAEDGTRVHIHYKSFGVPTPQSIRCASRAEELGLSRDRYTGRVHRIWKNKSGEQILTLWVELERDHMFRSFNLVKGNIFQFVVLGE